MTRSTHNRFDLPQAAAAAALLLGVCPGAAGDSGSSSVIDLGGARGVLPPSISIEDVMADAALTRRGATTIVQGAVPVPTAPPSVLLSFGDLLGSNAYAIYEGGAGTGEVVTLLPRTRAMLEFGWRELRDADGALAAMVQFTAELGTATLVEGGTGRPVLGLFIREVFHPATGASKAFAIESVSLLEEVSDLVTASAFVLQVEAWIAGPTAGEAEGAGAVPVDACQAMCGIFDAAQKQTCNIYLKNALEELFAEPLGELSLQPKGARPGHAAAPDAYLSLVAIAAEALGPGMTAALEAVSGCHDEVDDWTQECRTVVCTEAQ